MFSKKKAIKTVITLSTAFALCAPIAAPKTVYAFSFDADDVSTAIMLWQMLFPPKYPQPTEQKHPSQGSTESARFKHNQEEDVLRQQSKQGYSLRKYN